jgi:hypothetical protein
MPKMTLLEIVQDVLSDMNSDEVNSITDTPEALRVAQIAKSVFYEITGNAEWPHLNKLSKLDSSGSTLRPTHMSIPSNVIEVYWLKYNKIRDGETRNNYDEVTYLAPDAFTELANALTSSNDNVEVVTDFSGVSINIRNDKAPDYYTTFDDEWIVADSYDNSVDSTLQSTKTQVFTRVEASWSMVDGFIPDMPAHAFPHLLAEIKSTCFVRIKGEVDSKSEQQSRRQRRWLSHKSAKAQKGQMSSFGRRSAK